MHSIAHRALLGAALLALTGNIAHAQTKPPAAADWPTRAVRLLVSSAAGGSNDITARAVAADGYTLLHSGNLVTLNGVTKKVDYDVRKVFDIASQTTSQYYLLAVIPSMNIHSVKDLIAWAKAHPGELNYGSSGIGGVNHLGFEQLQLVTGTKMTHVPYKGNGQAFTDLMSGRLQMIFSLGASVGPFVRSGKLRAIAIASPTPSAAFPDVPTVAQTVPGFELGNSYFLYVPAGTAMPIQTGINRAINQVVNAPDVKEKFAADGAEPGPATTPADLKKAFVSEYAMWDNLIKKTGLKLSD